MKKEILVCVFLMLSLMAVALTGCANSGPVDKAVIVESHYWSELGSTPNEPAVIKPVKRGDLIFQGFDSTITVKSVNDKKIVLDVDGILVEPTPDGRIDFSKEPLTRIVLESGQSIQLVSLSMDAGVRVNIGFK